ncbi:uncharacterized protein [Vicugna pacos]|uniref:Uncharacterized protein isoform X1 n=1 Tax=Vicugna pacos TaxID=30538 RepID=A0ABM5CXM0_VICPA
MRGSWRQPVAPGPSPGRGTQLGVWAAAFRRLGCRCRCTKQDHQKPVNSKDNNSEKYCAVTVNPWHMKKDCKVLNDLRSYCYINIHRKHEPVNLTSSVLVYSWEQPDQCQSPCSHWLGACILPGMIFETCHTSRAFAVGWEASQSESALWNVLGDKLLFAKVYTLWEVLCTYAEILHIILPLKPNDLKTRSSAFGNFSCFMKVLQVDQSIIKPKQEFFIALFEKSCVNDFYIQDRDIFFNPTTRGRICDPSGCILELMTQLTIIMGGQSIWNNIQEVLLPSKGIDVVLPSVYHSMLCVHSLNRYSVWVHQIICGLFPVAPLLALENNILEIRLGTWKLDYKL